MISDVTLLRGYHRGFDFVLQNFKLTIKNKGNIPSFGAEKVATRETASPPPIAGATIIYAPSNGYDRERVCC